VTFNVGHVGLSNPDERLKATERYCKPCRDWYDARLSECPDCGTGRGPAGGNYRRWILDSHLQRQAQSVR